MDVKGYIGKILKVNLTDHTIKEFSLDKNIAKKYLGGKGYAIRLLYEYLNEFEKHGIDVKNIHPFSEYNVLIFATGPATGIIGFPSSGRYHVIALKSPLTKSIASANSGGKFGPFMKFAGYDIIIFEGKSPEPVYLEIIEGSVELKSAKHIWGKSTFETTRILSQKVGKNCSVACIGPAGENTVHFACVINEEHRAAGRTGIGAVMGAKKLKAIVVKGNTKPEIAKPDEFKQISKNVLIKIKKNPFTGKELPKYGTPFLVNVLHKAGAIPSRNWQKCYYNENELNKISGETLVEKYIKTRSTCWGCPIACAKRTEVKNDMFYVSNTEGPEYQSIWAFGITTEVIDLDVIIKAHNLCNELGLDVISMGSTIACAMELYEKGHISIEELQDLKLSFGNAGAIIEAIWRTAYKIGFGKYLALGSKRLAEIFGAPELSINVKGLEIPGFDPRAIKGLGLNYATANRGGCNVTGYTLFSEILGFPKKVDALTYEGKAMLVKNFQDFTCVVNSTVSCLFTTLAIGVEDYAKMLSCITGFEFNANELMKIGERIYNLERLIINKYGFDEKHDILPKRLLNEILPKGPAKGHVVELEKMKEEYYKLRGWVNGRPTKEKLKELDIP